MPLKPWQFVALAMLALLPALNSVDCCLEHDTWWHLAIGQQIVETRSVPEFDPLSRMSQQQPAPWRAYSWLFEVGVYEVYHHGGFRGLFLLRTALVALSTITVLLFLLRRGGATTVTMFTGALVMAALMMLAKERPWHFTIAFTTMTLWCVQALRDGLPLGKSLWLMPLFALWANLHIQFVLGWGILGLACLFPNRANRAGLLALTAGCFAATALNPYHVHLIEVIWEYATQAAPLQYVQELSPPDWYETSTITTAVLVIGGFVMTSRKKPIDYFELGLLLVAAVLAMRMRRDIWFAALAAIATLRMTPVSTRQLSAVAFSILVLMFGLRIVEFSRDGWSCDYEARQQKRFPFEGMNAIHSVPGPIFNEFDWGGYIAWQSGRPVSIDGRTNLYGNARMNQSFATWSTEEGWKDDPEFLTAKVVVAPRNRVLTEVLRKNASWYVLHEDELCVVFVRA